MLTVKQIEAAKPKEKPYRLLDGNGLYGSESRDSADVRRFFCRYAPPRQ